LRRRGWTAGAHRGRLSPARGYRQPRSGAVRRQVQRRRCPATRPFRLCRDQDTAAPRLRPEASPGDDEVPDPWLGTTPSSTGCSCSSNGPAAVSSASWLRRLASAVSPTGRRFRPASRTARSWHGSGDRRGGGSSLLLVVLDDVRWRTVSTSGFSLNSSRACADGADPTSGRAAPRAGRGAPVGVGQRVAGGRVVAQPMLLGHQLVDVCTTSRSSIPVLLMSSPRGRRHPPTLRQRRCAPNHRRHPVRLPSAPAAPRRAAARWLSPAPPRSTALRPAGATPCGARGCRRRHPVRLPFGPRRRHAVRLLGGCRQRRPVRLPSGRRRATPFDCSVAVARATPFACGAPGTGSTPGGISPRLQTPPRLRAPGPEVADEGASERRGDDALGHSGGDQR